MKKSWGLALLLCHFYIVKSEFTKADCCKDVEEGPIHCMAYIPVFKWDNEKQDCVEAIYGGCGATNNNFKTKKECQKIAAPVCCKCEPRMTKEDCLKDVQTPPTCKAYIRVFKWDDCQQACISAIYGGCHPTHNNFKTKEECEEIARPVCQKCD